jgi:hypothetical protein
VGWHTIENLGLSPVNFERPFLRGCIETDLCVSALHGNRLLRSLNERSERAYPLYGKARRYREVPRTLSQKNYPYLIFSYSNLLFWTGADGSKLTSNPFWPNYRFERFDSMFTSALGKVGLKSSHRMLPRCVLWDSHWQFPGRLHLSTPLARRSYEKSAIDDSACCRSEPICWSQNACINGGPLREFETTVSHESCVTLLLQKNCAPLV